MADINELQQKILAFREERDWAKFHKPKNLAISLALEAAEVLEHFQWIPDADVEAYCAQHKEALGDELADVLAYLLLLAHELDIDLSEAADRKRLKSAEKYPVDKAKGNATKYTEL